MSTVLQEALADEIVANSKRPIYKRKNKKEMLVSVGYATSTADVKQKEIIEQPGVKSALIARGFSVENANKVVGEILNKKDNKPRDRLTAADLVYKVHGAFAPEKHAIVLRKQIQFDE